MDNSSVLIIIGNIGIILVLLYLIRLSLFGSSNEYDKKSAKQARSKPNFRKTQDEPPLDEDNSFSENGKLKVDLSRNEVCCTDPNLRKRVVHNSKTANQQSQENLKDEESDHIQEELIKSFAAEEVEQSVNDEVGTSSPSSFVVGGETSFCSPGSSIQKHMLQRLPSFAEKFTYSVIGEAVGEIINKENREQFIDNLTEDILSKAVQEVIPSVSTTKQENSKLCVYDVFSEHCSCEIIADGIRIAAAHEYNSSIHESLVENSLREGMQIASAARQHAENLTSSVCKTAFKEATLSAELKPHVCGVVQNLLNEAIYEAVVRVNAVTKPSCQINTQELSLDPLCTTALESHVENSIHKLISSAIDAASSDKDQVLPHVDEELASGKLEEDTKQKEQVSVETASDAVSLNNNSFWEKKSKAPLSRDSFLDENEKDTTCMNGHLDNSELKTEQIVPTVSSLSSSVEHSSEAISEHKNLSHFNDDTSSALQVRNRDVTSPTGFWRRSLIEDLENDLDLDESLTSSSDRSELESPKVNETTSILSPTVQKSPAEFSDEEFIDSEEDEIIDYAQEAKMGAVGDSHQPSSTDVFKNNDHSDDDDDLDDDDDDLDDDDVLDSDDDEAFDGYPVVDGLCMSVPKDKQKEKASRVGRKHKHKHKPRHRIKSAGQHYNRAIVIDNGCGMLKAGFAGERKPRVVEPAVIGIPKRYSLQMTGMNTKKDRKYGLAATNAAGVLHLDYPVKPGMIDNWADIEDLWEYVLSSQLGVSEGDHPVVLTEVADNPTKNREKVAEILFEHLSVPAMYLADQLSLGLYASGMTSGVSVSSGFSVTEAAVVYEGHTLPYTAQQLDIAGQQLTENFRLLLRDNKGLNFVSSSEWQLVNTMKETMAFVAQDYSEEFNRYQTGATQPKYFTLPDGQVVEASSELISSVEPLFQPDCLVSANDTIASQLPLPQMVMEAINRCDVDLQDMCNRSVVLSGGTTMLTGLVPRLQQELQKLNRKIKKIRAPEERRIASWVGGSILASLSTFENQYITIEEYVDSGPSIVRRKCF